MKRDRGSDGSVPDLPDWLIHYFVTLRRPSDNVVGDPLSIYASSAPRWRRLLRKLPVTFPFVNGLANTPFLTYANA